MWPQAGPRLTLALPAGKLNKLSTSVALCLTEEDRNNSFHPDTWMCHQHLDMLDTVCSLCPCTCTSSTFFWKMVRSFFDQLSYSPHPTLTKAYQFCFLNVFLIHPLLSILTISAQAQAIIVSHLD